MPPPAVIQTVIPQKRSLRSNQEELQSNPKLLTCLTHSFSFPTKRLKTEAETKRDVLTLTPLCFQLFIFLPGDFCTAGITSSRHAVSAPSGIFIYDEKGGPPHPLSLGLKQRATSRPNSIAAVIPAAEAVSPPVRTPSRPFSSTAVLTPSASR